MISNHQSSGSRDKDIATPPPAINCPRCDSSNTKFCYYNNYSLSQPRHFCKACKRYWTKGGALRNVPIGGGCRKTKKTDKSFSNDLNDSFNASTYSDMDISKFLNDPDIQPVGGLTSFPSFNNTSKISTAGGQLFSSFTDVPTIPISSNTVPNVGLNPNFETILSQLMALNNFPLSYSSPSFILNQDHAENNTMSFNEGSLPEMIPNSDNLASSMEAFSSINQDIHWKLQQEKMSLMLNGGNSNIYQQQSGMIDTTNHLESFTQSPKPHPMLFNNQDISSKSSSASRKEIDEIINVTSSNLPNQWHFGDYTSIANEIPSISENDNEIQGWVDFDRYNSLP